ncbi:serine/threonine protein kinase [Calothrix sp. FACHB-1219]|uniref:serine/threonine-protein kinase n=1 Tax=unclassified Calothrix TaxID=2619626 RepID=UPI001682EC3F|nr:MULTISPECIES: serine/threonine-protein kinase [unclassified Calothrix]MBD2205998.1 serine/threonine protein kinase [Calothrix sp. FACHB-168]MBD2220827.1 serine/threonine protein kinase [Calothrix sp. FACHB-1219]
MAIFDSFKSSNSPGSICLCINLTCLHKPKNFNELYCQDCGADLLLNGRYRVIGLLNQRQIKESMVYDAIDMLDGGKPKVIKALYTDNEEAISRFNRGAYVLAKHWFPGLPQLDPGGYFPMNFPNQMIAYCLAMEKIAGLDLQELIESDNYLALTEQQVINWLEQLTVIVGNLHQKNFFHRDIKPANIMVRIQNEELVLIGIDAIRSITEAVLRGKNLSRIGTKGYVAPEQEKGKPVPQSDFYAMGRTFVHLLTGKAPNDLAEGADRKLLWRHSVPKLSNDLATLIDSLMAYSPEDRPRNTEEILQRLAEIKQNLQNENQSKKRLSFKKIVGLIVFLLVGVLGYIGIQSPKTDNISPQNATLSHPKCQIRQGKTVPEENALAKDVYQMLLEQKLRGKDPEIRQIELLNVMQSNCDLNIYVSLVENNLLSSSLENKITDLIRSRFDYAGKIQVNKY